jgi:hypothetical protein
MVEAVPKPYGFGTASVDKTFSCPMEEVRV